MKHAPLVAGIALGAGRGGGGQGGASASAGETLAPLDPGAVTRAIAGPPDPAVTGTPVRVSGPAGAWSGTGVRDVRSGRPVPAGGRYRIARISKVFTALTAIFQGCLVPREELGEMFTVPDVAYTGSTSDCHVGPDPTRASAPA